jgi:hypothetical protein
MSTRKKIVTRNKPIKYANGCVEFFPKVKKFEKNYECVDGLWQLKSGQTPSCSQKSKFALGNEFDHSYVCYPPTGRYRHLPDTPSAPRKKRTGTKGAKKSAKSTRGATAYNIFVSAMMKNPQFSGFATPKEKLAYISSKASQEWKEMDPAQKAEYAQMAKAKNSLKASAPLPAVSGRKLKTDFL